MILNTINHDILFSGPSFEIGKIHWYILKADTEMNERLWENEENSDKRINFGEMVGDDEIHWWIFKEETNIEELLEKTEKSLTAVQKLKEDSILLKKIYNFESYPDLVKRIKEFTQSHKEEIHTLYEYVLWLNKKNVLAPSILFTYRVWGTTRISDKAKKIIANEIDEDLPTVKICAEIALGLHSRFRYMLEDVYFEMHSRLADSVDPEFYNSISVSEKNVLVRASYEIFNELVEYFEFIRQSLRNILIEINKYKDQKKLLYSEPFWQTFIMKAITIPVENQLWDFKEALDFWYIKNNPKKDAEINFCEKIAAFANTKGGVLIVGITDKIPRTIQGIDDIENRLKFSETVITRYTNLERNSIYFQLIMLKDDTDSDKKCFIIAVAQTKDVISVKDISEKYSYPVRSETGIDRVDYKKIEESKKDIKKDNFDFISNLPL